ncbi:MAG: hypothetical protein EPGJADBJ_02582 [Saprospiraceae bacterium]|nr:hypothetical protein [Saprospiraceae bacterium]
MLLFAAKSQNTWLDSTFNHSGIFTGSIGGWDDPKFLLARQNGKVLLVGSTNSVDRNIPYVWNYIAAIVQFDENGMPDPGFGQQGAVVWPAYVDVNAAFLQTDGKLLTVFRGWPGCEVGRLNEDGSVDAGFGEQGVFKSDSLQNVSAIICQKDGKIIIGGAGSDSSAHPWALALLRLNYDGSVDTSFGENGYVFEDLGPGYSSFVQSLAFQGDSAIIIGGQKGGAALVARCDPDGLLDSSFGQNGFAPLSNVYTGIDKLLVQSDGKIVISGILPDFPVDHWFAGRLNADGLIDTSFEAQIGSGIVSDLTQQPDGGLLFCGPDFTVSNDSAAVRFFRYLPSGLFDTSFGDKVVQLPVSGFFKAGMFLLPDNKLVIGGGAENEFFLTDFCLTRLQADFSLDETFAQNGFAIKDNLFGNATATSVLADDQNRILMGGTIEKSQTFALQLLPDGSKDVSFSGDGLAPLVFNDTTKFLTLNLLARQNDGKILAAGEGQLLPGSSGFAVARMLPNGDFDTGFGTAGSGIAIATIEGSADYLTNARVLLQKSDGKILVAGHSYSYSTNKQKIAIARFLPDGHLDLSFGDAGVLVFQSGANYYEVAGGAILPDGKTLVAANHFVTQGGISQPVLARCLPNGQPDPNFGTGGLLSVNFPITFRLYGMALQTDGRILICGNSGAPGDQQIVVGRLNGDGTKDTSFGNDGLVIINTGAVETAKAIAVQTDGKIVLTGFSADSDVFENYDPLLVRLLPNGSPDTSFGNSGFLKTELPGQQELNALALQSDGNYLAAGYSGNQYLVVRYLNGLNVGVADVSSGATALLVYPNPVRGQAIFEYTLTQAGAVSLELFDLRGRRRHTFFQNEKRPAGDHRETILFPASLEPGAYVLCLRTGKGTVSVRVIAP